MYRLFIWGILVFILSLTATAQSYLGYTTTTVNLRTQPNTSCAVLKSVSAGSPLFVVSSVQIDGFFQVLDIESNVEGYIYGSYVRLDKPIPKNEEGIFTPTGQSSNYQPTLNIFNNTNITLTLKLNEVSYTFNPKQRRSLTLNPGQYTYRASAPGVLPDYGTENMQSNYEYQWEFYISTRYR